MTCLGLTTKRTRLWLSSALLSGFLLCLSSGQARADDKLQTPAIVIDQFGYLTHSHKMAAIRVPVIGYDAKQNYSPSDTYQVIDVATKNVVYQGMIRSWHNGEVDASSGDRVWYFDFSQLAKPGRYLIRDAKAGVESYPFDIGDNVYRPVLVAAVKYFYYQRADIKKDERFAEKAWADGLSHMGPNQDSEAHLFNKPNDPSTQRDLRGGWYDAGDLNKYTSWTASYVVTLLQAYQENPKIWSDDFGIPESGNGVPDLLDETKWGLDWVVRMQSDDGGVLSVMGLSHASPPSTAKGPSLYGPESTSATLGAASAYAYGAKIYGQFPQFKSYADDLAVRAEKAWNWALAHPNAVFKNNDAGFHSQGLAAGQQEVDDYNLRIKALNAAIYLFDLTGKDEYRDYVDQFYTDLHLFTQGRLEAFDVNLTDPILHYITLKGANPATVEAVKAAWKKALHPDEKSRDVSWVSYQKEFDPYRAFLPAYSWGSSSVHARAGLLFVDETTYIPGSEDNKAAMDAAEDYVHYFHGFNPLGKVYLSNMSRFGATNSVNEFYHTWYTKKSPLWGNVKTSKYGPPPGYLVGGPNSSYRWDRSCPQNPACTTPAPSPPVGQPAQKSYADFGDGWPLNSWEVTENSDGYQVEYIRLLSKFVH